MARFPIPVVHQALEEMEGAGARFSLRTLIRFAEKVIPDRAPPPYVEAKPAPPPCCTMVPRTSEKGRIEGLDHAPDCSRRTG